MLFLLSLLLIRQCFFAGHCFVTAGDCVKGRAWWAAHFLVAHLIAIYLTYLRMYYFRWWCFFWVECFVCGQRSGVWMTAREIYWGGEYKTRLHRLVHVAGVGRGGSRGQASSASKLCSCFVGKKCQTQLKFSFVTSEAQIMSRLKSKYWWKFPHWFLSYMCRCNADRWDQKSSEEC